MIGENLPTFERREIVASSRSHNRIRNVNGK